EGMTIEVEKLLVEENAKYQFDKVLLIADGKEQILVGQPYVEGASVEAKVLGQDKDPKIVIFKYKRKTGYRRKTGHRQPLTRLVIEGIVLGKTSKKTETKPVTEKAPVVDARAEQPNTVKDENKEA
ncbi:50S ribosomal protein L21, partial [Candidatus Margulisiibacteriota bacterium]